MAKLMTIRQTMERLSVGRTRLWKLRRSGDFPEPVMIDTSVRFREVEIERWISAHQRVSTRRPAR